MIRNAKTNLIQFVLYLFLNPLPSDRLHCILHFTRFGDFAYSHIVLYNLSAYRLLISLCQIKIMNIHFSRCHRLLLPFGFVAAYFVEFVRDVQFVACYVVLIFSLFFFALRRFALPSLCSFIAWHFTFMWMMSFVQPLILRCWWVFFSILIFTRGAHNNTTVTIRLLIPLQTAWFIRVDIQRLFGLLFFVDYHSRFFVILLFFLTVAIVFLWICTPQAFFSGCLIVHWQCFSAGTGKKRHSLETPHCRHLIDEWKWTFVSHLFSNIE